jgi:hypothetical protein
LGIAFRAAGTLQQVDTGTSLPFTLPTGTVSTDIILVGFQYDGGTGITITPPSGWTLIARQDNSTVSGGACYWALGNVSSLTFTITGTTAIGNTISYSGVNNNTPMDATGTSQANAASTTLTAPSITTVTNSAWVVNFWSQEAIAPTFSSYTGTNTRDSGHITPTSSDPNAYFFGDFIQVSHGSTGTKTVTSSVSGTSQGITIALRPAVFIPDIIIAPYLPAELRV